MIQDFYPFSQLLASEMNHVCLVMGTMVHVTGMFLREIIFTKFFREIDFTEIYVFVFVYSSSECTKKGGQASGSCASGFGVCCLFTKNCGAMTNQNNSLFQNNGFPSTYDNVGSCQLTVNKCDSGVCQLRLNFHNFVLRQPESIDHQCQDDQFIVSGGSPIPGICGKTNLYLYFKKSYNLKINGIVSNVHNPVS